MLDQIYDIFSISKRSYETDSEIYSNKFERYINCQSGIYHINGEEKHNHGHSLKSEEMSHLKFKASNLYDSYCASIHCKIDHLKTDESAIIRLRFRLWASTLALVCFDYKIKLFKLQCEFIFRTLKFTR